MMESMLGEYGEKLAEGSLQDSGDVIQDALVAIRNHLGMEIAYFSEFVGNESVFRRVDAPGLEHLIKPGDRRSLDDVYCKLILDGRLPELMPDTSKEPLARAMAITQAVPIGSHVSVPVTLADGTPFGMFCCLSPHPNPSLNQRDLDTMRVFAGLAAKQVNGELELRRAQLEKKAAIESVIDGRGYEIVVQPIFDLRRMEVYALEALCRFSSRPYRSPDQWFRDAWEIGRGIDLELAVIATSLELFRHLPEHILLSLNASPGTVAGGGFEAVIPPALRHRLILEITEHAAVDDYAALQGSLARLKRSGMKVAVDDAGAGYSGLQHMVQIEPDIIKLDMSLTRGIDADPARRALASAMIFYAHETGSTVLAEGVETEAELATLKTLGVGRGQGFLLGRPQPLAFYGGALALRQRA